MILIIAGTQTKQFERLFKVVDNAIQKGIINDDVVAQLGYTKFKSPNMKTFDFIEETELNKYIKKADLIVSHGGIGSITSSIKADKKVFAMARLEKFKEHKNDHQLQIVNKFHDLGYIRKIEDYDDFIREYKNLNKFKPKKPKFGNTKIIDIITEFIG